MNTALVIILGFHLIGALFAWIVTSLVLRIKEYKRLFYK